VAVTAGMLFAMTLPGLVVLLVAVAVLERAASARGRRGVVTRRRRPAVSAAGLDVLSTALMPEKERELEQRQRDTVRRQEATDGAPPHGVSVDLTSGVARVRRPSA
jgi:hypothetical protein